MKFSLTAKGEQRISTQNDHILSKHPDSTFDRSPVIISRKDAMKKSTMNSIEKRQGCFAVAIYTDEDVFIILLLQPYFTNVVNNEVSKVSTFSVKYNPSNA